MMLRVVLALSVVSVALSMTEEQVQKAIYDGWRYYSKDPTTICGKLQNLSHADLLRKELKDANCPLDKLYCQYAFMNAYVDTSVNYLSGVSESDNTYIVQVRCIRLQNNNLVPTYANNSFISFVANADVHDVTAKTEDTFSFYEDVSLVPDAAFQEWYEDNVSFATTLIPLCSTLLAAVFLNKLLL